MCVYVCVCVCVLLGGTPASGGTAENNDGCRAGEGPRRAHAEATQHPAAGRP